MNGPDPGLAPLLRAAVETGSFAGIEQVMEPGALLDSNSEAGRRRVEGREAILAHLGSQGPGEVLEWDAREWTGGVAATFEWRGTAGTDRRRWYLRTSGGEIVNWWSYAARPRSLPAPGAQIPADVLERIAPGARRAPLTHGGNSGAALERVELQDGTGLIAKRVGPGGDWLGRITGDRGRTALLWEAGVFDRLPASIDHGIESVVSDGDGWWVVMRDLSAHFLADGRVLSRAESRRVMEVAALMHREFAGDAIEGAARLENRLGMSSLRVADAERDGPDLLPKQLEAAWDAFGDCAPDDVAAEVLAAVADPVPLSAALQAAGPETLIHGDLRDDNMGLDGERVVLLDWDLAAAGTPTVEFAWYLCHDAWRIEAGHDEVEADYRAAEGDTLNETEVELGMLSGLVQYGWIFGHSLLIHPDPVEQAWAREELDWWVPRVRLALDRVGGAPR